MSAPSKLSSTPPPLANAAGSPEATRKSDGGPSGGSGAIAEPGNSSGSEDRLELSTSGWGSVAAGKCARRSALRIAATAASFRGAAPIKLCLSEPEQSDNEQTIAVTAQI